MLGIGQIDGYPLISRHKRPFILIEILITIALLTLSAFPLLSSSLHFFSKQRESLLKLELEREAELHFYSILKHAVPKLYYNEIPVERSNEYPLKEFTHSFGGIKQKYYPHYHLFYAKNSGSETHKKVFCHICFLTSKVKGERDCPNREGKTKTQFSKEAFPFAFLVKKVAKNPTDLDGDKKAQEAKGDEKLGGTIQTLHSIK